MKKIKSSDNPITIVKGVIKGLNFKGIDSIAAYQHNGYRQWGNVHKEIEDALHGKLSRCVAIYGEVKERQREIAKTRGGSIFQLVERLGYKVDDLRIAVGALGDAITNSDICKRYAEHEAINGEGRRLGLKTLQSRTYDTMKNLISIIDDCKKVISQYYVMYSNGYDPNRRYRMIR